LAVESPNALPDSTQSPRPPANLREIVATLFELGREVTSVLDLEELLQKIPQLISRLTHFHAFAAYLLDEKAGELKVAYSVGYPDTTRIRLRLSEGIVGRVVESQQALVIGDVSADPHYIEVVPGTDHLLILSSGPAALLEIDGNGVPQGELRLPRRHAQPEGLAIAANGDIFISDEGGNGGGTLAIYRCHP